MNVLEEYDASILIIYILPYTIRNIVIELLFDYNVIMAMSHNNSIV